MQMSFMELTSLNSIPRSIQVHFELCEISGAKVFAFSHSCDFESKSR